MFGAPGCSPVSNPLIHHGFLPNISLTLYSPALACHRYFLATTEILLTFPESTSPLLINMKQITSTPKMLRTKFVRTTAHRHTIYNIYTKAA